MNPTGLHALPDARHQAALRAASTAGRRSAGQYPGCRRHIRPPPGDRCLAANVHDTKGIIPVLRELAGEGFQAPAMSDLGYRGKRLAKAGQALGISVEAIAPGREGQFVPVGICRVVERSFGWLSRYRRLNT